MNLTTPRSDAWSLLVILAAMFAWDAADRHLNPLPPTPWDTCKSTGATDAECRWILAPVDMGPNETPDSCDEW